MKPWIIRIGSQKYRIEPAGQITVIVLAVLLFALLFALIFGGGKKKDTASVEETPQASSSPKESIAPTLDPKEYEGTILAATKDAGEDYVNSTLFLGDSNTARFLKVVNPETKTSYGTKSNTIGVVGMGIDAINSLACMDFSTGRYTMPRSVAILQPERVIITMGTNNLSGSNTDYTDFINRYTAQIKAIQDAYPSVDIIVNSIPPVAKNSTYYNVKMVQIDAWNEGIAKMCEKNGWKYLNSAEALIDSSTGYAKSGYMVSDGLHLSQEGLSALFDYIRTHSWITEDDRPKPLASIPNIIGVPDGLIRTDPLTSEEFKEDPSAAETEGNPAVLDPSASPQADTTSQYGNADACAAENYFWSQTLNHCFASEEEKKAAETSAKKQACINSGYEWDDEKNACEVEIAGETPQPSASPDAEDSEENPNPTETPEGDSDPEKEEGQEPTPTPESEQQEESTGQNPWGQWGNQWGQWGNGWGGQQSGEG